MIPPEWADALTAFNIREWIQNSLFSLTAFGFKHINYILKLKYTKNG
jgi:hypothetical protein